MRDEEYPDEPAGPYEPPPRSFTDREGRDVEVREYAGEREPLTEMYVAFDPEDRAQGIPPSGEEKVREWLDTILGEGCLNVVAWHGDDAAGHATLVPDGQGAYELAIFVLHEYQEAGIGTQLMEALLGLGRREGVGRVWLTVERWNRAAVGLYRKVGFVPSESGNFELEMGTRLR